jgi:hypothetical protein
MMIVNALERNEVDAVIPALRYLSSPRFAFELERKDFRMRKFRYRLNFSAVRSWVVDEVMAMDNNV